MRPQTRQALPLILAAILAGAILIFIARSLAVQAHASEPVPGPPVAADGESG